MKLFHKKYETHCELKCGGFEFRLRNNIISETSDSCFSDQGATGDLHGQPLPYAMNNLKVSAGNGDISALCTRVSLYKV
jgi:hypothetical protein